MNPYRLPLRWTGLVGLTALVVALLCNNDNDIAVGLVGTALIACGFGLYWLTNETNN